MDKEETGERGKVWGGEREEGDPGGRQTGGEDR